MKQLELQSPSYQALEKSYQEWLERLGYSAQTCYMLPIHVREFLYWLEQRGKLDLSLVGSEEVEGFIDHFSVRRNERRGGGLSQNYINKLVYALKLLSQYLSALGVCKLKVERAYVKSAVLKKALILSPGQINQLYGVCGNDPLGQRDRAMLSIYYGCGLRRSEGVRLSVSDVLFDRGLLHVRKTKNRWERYVPMALRVRQDLEGYIYGGRKLLSSKVSPKVLFLSEHGKGLGGASLMKRLKQLLGQSGLPEKVTLHGLRHSIASHLLSGGMDLEEVADFLGHRHLDSSQLYTHLKERVWKK